ncbi:hypothetical protein COCON_G00126530 [Conger conger]|uniref:Uncharacterized protein n=1 Tax=Conger conger TaxID=82655 RepID=A0A9Q1DD41_CONCO|nr:hypothetical protein COCON_G00126530 [Conger conger]
MQPRPIAEGRRMRSRQDSSSVGPHLAFWRGSLWIRRALRCTGGGSSVDVRSLPHNTRRLRGKLVGHQPLSSSPRLCPGHDQPNCVNAIDTVSFVHVLPSGSLPLSF